MRPYRRRSWLHLPGPVHLVAEAPELDAVRLLGQPWPAQVGQRRAAGMVAVFEQAARGVGAARAEVDGEHRLDAGGAAPVDESLVPNWLVSVESQARSSRRGRCSPGRRHPPSGSRRRSCRRDSGRWWRRVRAPAPARRAESRCASAVGMAGLEDAAVDAAAEVLDEGAEQAAIGVADDGVAAEDDRGVAHQGVIRARRAFWRSACVHHLGRCHHSKRTGESSPWPTQRQSRLHAARLRRDRRRAQRPSSSRSPTAAASPRRDRAGRHRHHAVLPDRDGRGADVVLGRRPGRLPGRNPYFGTIVGRYATASPTAAPLDGATGAANNGPNALHGGPSGFDKRCGRSSRPRGARQRRARAASPDGDQGYPGALRCGCPTRSTPRNGASTTTRPPTGRRSST